MLLINLARLYNRNAPWDRGKTRLAEWAAQMAGLRGTVTYETLFGATLILDLSQYISRRIYIDGCYEPHVLRAMDVIGREFGCKTVVDVGANIGQHSIFAALSLHPALVYAIEPCPATNQRLKENVRLNSLESRVQIRDVALSDVAGYAFINVPSTANDGANYLVDQASDHKSIAVKVDTLDAFADRQDLDRIDILKIDVEGAEYKVLLGARRLLSQNRIGVALVELCEENLARSGASISHILKVFSEYGYIAYRLGGRRLIEIHSGDVIKGVQMGLFVYGATRNRLLRAFS